MNDGSLTNHLFIFLPHPTTIHCLTMVKASIATGWFLR